MEAMLGISLYSNLYTSKQKCYIFLIISCVFSSTKLEKRAEQVLSGSEGGAGKEWGREGGEMAQTMYAHMNKWINNKRKLWGQ
jgi:hypothetical protein